VLDDAGIVVGGAGFAPLRDGPRETCELRKMYLRPQTRGTGLGRRLLAHVLDAARRAGYERCYNETMATMQRARALYESFGFEKLPGPRGATGHFGCDAWYARDL
jgi:putative acetyltransferase